MRTNRGYAPLAALDRTASPQLVARRVDEPILDPLVIALAVVVLDVLAYRLSQMSVTDRDHLRQALRLDRSDESLGMRVQIRAATREPHGVHS